MDERILALLGSFAEIERELGADVLDSAIERARLAVAAEVMVKAERRALKTRREFARTAHSDGNVVQFPTVLRNYPDGGCA
ncbi:hypothetical protein [Methylobacterium sp. J-070]|uniref:hypothetical protein n=1 Tax=Methylobacterium sp. J-070 TaxID=2836650 RepID=UPI001FBA0A6B|nr:hypothetical protein [Methylobacterium sp. J-070]MCJ2050266.1 hypothetical protein [Methylobacterium sp. J-070]